MNSRGSGLWPWRTAIVTGVSSLAGLIFVMWLLATEQQQRYNDAILSDLRHDAEVFAAITSSVWPDLSAPLFQNVAALLKRDQVTYAVLDLDGATLLWNVNDDEAATRAPKPELIQAAVTNGAATSRYVQPDDQRGFIHLQRVGPDHAPLGLVWLAKPQWSFFDDLYGVGRALLIAVAFVAALTIAITVLMARLRRRMLTRLVRSARRLSEGDLQTDLGIRGSSDLAILSGSLNTLRRRLLSQVETIDRQRRTLDALVHQLQEGVVVARRDGRIVMMNPAAAKLLSIRLDENGLQTVIGRPIEHCIPQHPLQKLLLGSTDDVEDEEAEDPIEGFGGPFSGFQNKPIAVDGDDGTFHLLATATDLALPTDASDSDDGQPVGRMLVLTDVTELQRTIQLRTDFVANASHELRTPLSTIRAAVETLTAMDLQTEAAAASQFLQAINRHSWRLERMVADLLDLSRLESPTKRFEPETLRAALVFEELQARVSEPLDRKGVRLGCVIGDDAQTLRVNHHLLNLVLGNLVDNAIKFTDSGGDVTVSFSRDNGEVVLQVRDTGCGIPPEDVDRVFERFYQVERGRSGRERGTGLGLSIVRHAIGALRGSVKLESALGVGTTVTVRIPQ